MSSQPLLLDRVEFGLIKIETLQGEFPIDRGFPQIAIDSEELTILTRSNLVYPQDQTPDPRLFALTYGVKVTGENVADDRRPPYEIEVEAIGYFRYVGDESFAGAERFRAVRFSGYQILYGAIREMVCNLTARGRHGLLHLPARNFGTIAKLHADEDEMKRERALSELVSEVSNEAPKTARRRGSKAASKKIDV